MADIDRNKKASSAVTVVDEAEENSLVINNEGQAHSVSFGKNPNLENTEKNVSGVVASNSSSTPLGASGNFTGAWENCEKYNSISATILTDQFSAIDGARIEFSIDGTVGGIIRTIKTTIIPTTDGLYFSVPCEGKFFRINYTNNVVAQTVFKASVELKTEQIGSSTLPLNAPLTDDNSVPINRSIITGRGANQAYANQRTTDVSTKNSTSTALLAGEQWVGEWEEITGYSNITMISSSDQDSAEDGLIIDWSSDGVNVDDSDVFTSIKNGVTGGRSYSFGAITKYFRITYENGAFDQTFFRLQAILHTARPKPSSHRILDDISGQNDAELVRAVLTGVNPDTGKFGNVGSKDGRLQVESINVAAQLSERFRRYALNGASNEMNVDGSGTPVEFVIDADPSDELTVDFISIQAFASGIKIDKFLGLNQDLTNGLLIEIKSEDKLFQFLPITNTTEFNSLFAFGSGRAFDLVFASGNDSMVATFGPNSPFILKPQGTYATNDYIKILVRDNISSISRLRALAGGRVK